MKLENKDKFVKGSINTNSFKGYFVGRFLGEKGFPSQETEEVEIAWKELPIEFNEGFHIHKRGVEINIVISGKYRLIVNDKELELVKGDFLIVYPQSKLRNLSSDVGTEVIVVKAPSVPDDKFDVTE